ncbi:MAG: GDP-mannose 4,6-dehydratase, partial [Cyanobacteria bacterium J06553_1]
MLKRVLITGGAGFIGSNFVHHWCKKYDGRVVVLDILGYAGNEANVADLKSQDKFRLVKGDICDGKLVAELLEEEEIDTVIHFAAESHVDRSILGPAAFVQTNVVGTFTLLEAFRNRWTKQGKPG